MNVAQAAQLVRKYADEATGRLKPEEDGYMGADGRQLFETQPLDEFIVDIRKELLDVMNYAAFGLHRLDEILSDVNHLMRAQEPMSPAGMVDANLDAAAAEQDVVLSQGIYTAREPEQ